MSERNTNLKQKTKLAATEVKHKQQRMKYSDMKNIQVPTGNHFTPYRFVNEIVE
jgi:hypothetical protein